MTLVRSTKPRERKSQGLTTLKAEQGCEFNVHFGDGVGVARCISCDMKEAERRKGLDLERSTDRLGEQSITRQQGP